METDEDATEEYHDEHDEELLYTVRGGSFSEANLLYITTFGRYGLHADEDLPLLGFRCVRDVVEKQKGA